MANRIADSITAELINLKIAQSVSDPPNDDMNTLTQLSKKSICAGFFKNVSLATGGGKNRSLDWLTLQ